MKKILTLCIIFISFVNLAKASHSRGSEITYQHISNLDYKIKVKNYRDCGGVTNPASILISASNSSLTTPISYTLALVSSTEMQQYCSSIVTNCSNISSTNIGIMVDNYEAVVTLPSTAPDWKFSSSICCRPNNVINLGPTSSGSYNQYVETTLNNSNSIVNSSVQYVGNASLIYPVNTNSQMNGSLIDPDGDSLFVESVAPKDNAIISIFSPGFTGNNPFGNNPFTINPSNGNISFLLNTIGKYAIAFKISEYRNGVLIAQSIRDLTFSSGNFSTSNLLPTLSGVNGTSNNFININACIGSNLSFTLNSADGNALDSSFVTWDTTINGAVVTVNNAQNQTATFNWSPTQANVQPQPYVVVFHVKDNNCGMPNIQSYGYLIYVNQCNTDSVWAGDANADFIVNNYDVLNIGVANGVTGAVRPSATTNWQAEYCPNWTNNFMSGINHKHADCNGDGTINATDLSAVALNYGQVHLKEGQETQNKTLGFPDLYFDTNNITANQGSTLSIPVMFGSSSTVLTNFYGLAGTIEVVNAQTSNPISFNNSTCWIGNASNSILFTKNTATSKIDFTIVRKNQTNTSGYGQIGTLTLPVTINDLLGSNLILKFSNVKIIKNDETEITDFNVFFDTLMVNAPLSISNVEAENNIKIYPNPVTNILNIEFSSLENIADKIELINIFGETISTLEVKQNQTNVVLNTSTLSKGIYFIKLINTNTNEVYNKRFVK